MVGRWSGCARRPFWSMCWSLRSISATRVLFVAGRVWANALARRRRTVARRMCVLSMNPGGCGELRDFPTDRWESLVPPLPPKNGEGGAANLRSKLCGALGGGASVSVHRACDGAHGQRQALHNVVEACEIERLRAVGQGALRTGMHLDDDAVGAEGQGGSGHGCNQAATAGAMGRIGDHRQMEIGRAS